MDSEELKKLNTTDYFKLVVSILGSFDKVTYSTYQQILKDNDADVVIKEDTASKVHMNFKHDNKAFGDLTLDFKNGNLENFRALILSVGFNRKNMAKHFRDKLLTFLEKLSKHTNTDLETVKKKNIYRLVLNNKIITLNMDKNLSSGQPYVSIWCEYIK